MIKNTFQLAASKTLLIIFFIILCGYNAHAFGRVLDNGDTGTSSNEMWSTSADVEPYDIDFLWSRIIGAEYSYEPGATGLYTVALWWWTKYSHSVYTPPLVMILDNGDTGTSGNGVWTTSAGLNPYGTDSFYSKKIGAEYSYELAVVGLFEVSLWWTEYSSRCRNVPVDIYDGNHLLGNVQVDQLENGGIWNIVGEYNFTGTGRVVIRSEYSSCSTSADAVKFTSRMPAGLDHIKIEGQVMVDENSSADYELRAYYIGGSSQPVEADTWSVECPTLAEIDYVGRLHSFDVLSDQSCRISAFYSERGSSTSATFDFTIVDLLSTSEIIIDDGDPGTSSYYSWSVSSEGYNSDSLLSSVVWASYSYETALHGPYEISLWWTASPSYCASVPVKIFDGNVLIDILYVNQQGDGGQWNVMGAYYFNENARINIISQDDSCITNADAVQFSPVTSPFLNIDGVHNYYLQNSTDLYLNLSSYNAPDNWSVEMILDADTQDETSASITSRPYFVHFTNLAKGEHTLDAYFLDEEGVRVPDLYAHANRIQVGIGGNYYVAMGDSITKGIGDVEFFDNFSADGRNVSRGFTPILNDLLTSSVENPHSIANEGIGGTVSAEGVAIISSLLAKHERSQRFLVQYGTNDSYHFLPVPSGKGLNPGDAYYPGTFKDNMQQIVDAVGAASKDLCLAKPPITLGDTTTGDQFVDVDAGFRNLLIREYADVIDELIADIDNSIDIAAPDFYNYFREIDPATGNQRYIDQYFDNLHPNSIGYQSMANLWYQKLMELIQ